MYRHILGLLLLSLSSCYSPNIASGQFKCGEGGACPAGFYCRDNLCVAAGEAVDMSIDEALDLSMSAPGDLASVPDMARRDLSQPDLSQPDLSQRDLVTVADQAGPPCTGGIQVGKAGTEVWACPGVFNGLSEAQKLCPAAMPLCDKGDNVDEAACKSKVSGFFMIASAASYDGYNAGSGMFMGQKCDNSQAIKALLGCGSVVTAPLGGGGCKSLNTQIACNNVGSTGQGVSGWSCGSSGYQDPKNVNTNGGVLCCK